MLIPFRFKCFPFGFFLPAETEPFQIHFFSAKPGYCLVELTNSLGCVSNQGKGILVMRSVPQSALILITRLTLGYPRTGTIGLATPHGCQPRSADQLLPWLRSRIDCPWTRRHPNNGGVRVGHRAEATGV